MRTTLALLALISVCPLAYAEEGAAPEPPATAEEAKPAKKAKGYLGIGTSEAEGGVRVEQVQPGSPAEAAGFQKGDLLEAVNGTPVPTPAVLAEVLGSLTAGTEVVCKVCRESGCVELKATLAKRPKPQGPQAGGAPPTLDDILRMLPAESQEAARAKAQAFQAKAKAREAEILKENPGMPPAEVQARVQQELQGEFQEMMQGFMAEAQAARKAQKREMRKAEEKEEGKP